MQDDRNGAARKVSAVCRAAIAAISAIIVAWALLPFVWFSIFNLGTAALLAVFLPTLLAAVFWRQVRRTVSAIRRKKAAKHLLRAAALLLAVCVGFASAAAGHMIAAAENKPSGDRPLPVIVLGCQTYGYTPSPLLLSRLQAAKAYLDDNPDAVAIVSGGKGGNESVSEAESMRAWLEENGIAPERIRKEERSSDTEENLRFSAELMQRERLGTQAVIVTDWWHELRAAHWAKQNGLQPAAEPCATWLPLLPVFFARELCGVARLWLAGY